MLRCSFYFKQGSPPAIVQVPGVLEHIKSKKIDGRPSSKWTKDEFLKVLHKYVNNSKNVCLVEGEIYKFIYSFTKSKWRTSLLGAHRERLCTQDFIMDNGKKFPFKQDYFRFMIVDKLPPHYRWAIATGKKIIIYPLHVGD